MAKNPRRGGKPSKKPKKNLRPKPRQTGSSNQSAGGPAQTAPAQTIPAPNPLSMGERGRLLGRELGQKGGEYGRMAGSAGVSAPLGFAEGIGQSIGGEVAGNLGSMLGGAAAKYGTLYYALNKLYPLAESGWSRMTESDEKKEVRIKTEQQKKYEKKVSDAIMGSRTDGFTIDDLDTADKSQDAGWREAIDGMKDDEYEKLASDSIKANDPNMIWNAVVRKAQAAGKKVNASKPLYLPNTFTKGGKTYAYALDASERDDNNRPKVRFVPIEIGKRPFEPESK
jgi:hypothetical protein